MKTIKQLLDSKGHEVFTVSPDAKVFEAITIMADKQVGSLIVTKNGKPVGIITERDYARKVVLKGRFSKDIRVEDIMTKRLACASPSQTVEEGMAFMTEKRIRHLPVVEGGALVGIVSIGDLVKSIIEEQQFVIDQLVHYIHG